MRVEIETLRGELGALELRARRDLYHAAEVAAATEIAAFVLTNLPTALMFAWPEDTLRHAAGLVTVTGSVLEFGVASGHTLRLLVDALPGRTTAGFDVFTGLPEGNHSASGVTGGAGVTGVAA